jgi:two-component system, cell cycle sensor histidine kinase and response regulator CckA
VQHIGTRGTFPPVRVPRVCGGTRMSQHHDPRQDARPDGSHVPAPASSSPSAAAPPTVMLVDDEPSVRRLVETVLRSRGYQVVTAGGGKEALALLERPEAAGYAALVTDVVMPGLGGFDVATRYLASHPGSRAVLMSGSITAEEAADPRFAGRAEFIAKPFRAATLLERVESALSAAAAYAASVDRSRAA